MPAASTARVPTPPAPARPAPAPPVASAEAAPPRRIPGWLVGLAVVALAGIVWLLVGRRTEPPRPAPPEPVMDPVPAPAQAPPAAPAAPRGSATTGSRPTATTPKAEATTNAGSSGDVTVGEAQLCTALVAYRCTAAASPVRAGQITFYTRIVATRDTAVIHRWYRGNQVRQSVRLSVPARAAGFRTFSRGTVSAGGGDWRVELRTVDGRVLHTETFQVK
jgi:hypothetical protein